MEGSPLATTLLVAELQARVAALEAELARRSAELSALQRTLCRRDLVTLDRLAAGLPPLPPPDPLDWEETLEPRSADVEEVLTTLWQAVAPPAERADDG